MPSDADAVCEAARLIKMYLDQHPKATDTSHGIYNWWLRQSKPPVPELLIAEALDQLVASGYLDTRQTLNGDTLFMRRTRKADF